MVSRKTLILSVAIAVVVTVPAVAWAVGSPFGADPQPPMVGGETETDAPYGWMGQMHDYMWNNGELPENLPADTANWMNQMHDYMWGDTPADGSYGWMGQMHDYMWNNGELPEDFPADADWMNQMHDYMWGGGRSAAQIDPGSQSSNDSVSSGSNVQGAATAQPVPGPRWGGCGMWGGR